jgi:hypothetical protein
MSKRNIGLYALLGLLGATGAGVGYSLFKKKKPVNAVKNEPVEEKPDTPPAMIECPDCGNRFKEYELYCPYCRQSVQQAGSPVE